MKTLTIADLFCGAGGTSTGAIEAANACGYEAALTAVNHWDTAIATHEQNHPNARHLCTGIDDINPRALYREGELDLLWASPECTHHSVARGGKPINEQSRATAWCVARWAEALRPAVILVENVPEFVTWGGLCIDGKPLKAQKGKTFAAWVSALESLGYRVDWRVLCAADYGDPTTRRRLFVQAVRGKRKIVWPEPTHAPVAEGDMFGSRKRWVAAREIIDWQLPAGSIYERKRPLSEKTMRRIFEGLKKFGLKPFMTPGQGEREGQAPRTHSVDDPAPTVAATGHIHLAQSIIIPQHSTNDARSVDQPAPTVTTTSRGVGLAQAALICMEHQGSVRSVDQPMPTITTAKGGAIGVAEFIVGAGGPEYAAKPQSVEEPVNTVTTENHRGLAQAFIVRTAHGNDDKTGDVRRVRDLDKPLDAVPCSTDMALVEPFIMSAGGPVCPARPVSQPMGTVLTRDHRALVDPYLVKLRGSDDAHVAASARSIEEPVPTISTGGNHALAEPFLVDFHGTGGADSLDKPIGAVCTKPKLGLCEALLPQQSGGALRSVEEPAPTVATDGAVGLVEPFLIEYYGNGGAESVEDPLNTVTTKDRHALVRPVVTINGQKYLLDIRFRMLQPHELAAAQGFKKGYKFTGNKTEQVKQIGNAVPRRLARAIVTAALTQRSDVSRLCGD